MTTNKQVQMVMRDMLFVTWAIPSELVRKVVDTRLELETRTNEDGSNEAFVSAVCFRVSDVRSSILPLGNLSFNHVSYRTYVKGPVPAVCFLDLKVNSRMVTTVTSFMNIPVHYDDIDITTTPGDSDSLRYVVNSGGFKAAAIVESGDSSTRREILEPEFIIDRSLGYMGVGNGMFRIDVEQTGLEAVVARIDQLQPPGLVRLKLIESEHAPLPISVLYVNKALFEADTPVREW